MLGVRSYCIRMQFNILSHSKKKKKFEFEHEKMVMNEVNCTAWALQTTTTTTKIKTNQTNKACPRSSYVEEHDLL